MAKFIYILIFLVCHGMADTTKVYYYTTENNINDFKTLKVSFDAYLKEYGDYEFQAFSDQETFESYLNEERSIVLLSSWHYQKIHYKYGLYPRLIAKKNNSILTTKILIGKDGMSEGTVATAYSQGLVTSMNYAKHLKMINVPKDIDAVMSVSFGMNQYALISQDSFENFQKNNSYLMKGMKVYKQSAPVYRMLVVSNSKDTDVKVFKNMKDKTDAKKLLDILGVENIVEININDKKQLGSIQ